MPERKNLPMEGFACSQLCKCFAQSVDIPMVMSICVYIRLPQIYSSQSGEPPQQGKQIVNIVPRPILLSISRVPCSKSVNLLTMLNPNPVPGILLTLRPR